LFIPSFAVHVEQLREPFPIAVIDHPGDRFHHLSIDFFRRPLRSYFNDPPEARQKMSLYSHIVLYSIEHLESSRCAQQSRIGLWSPAFKAIHAYDADGIRVISHVNGTMTSHLVDQNRSSFFTCVHPLIPKKELPE